MLDLQDTRLFQDVSFFPFQLILFFDLFFSLHLYCIVSGDPPPPSPRSGHFYLLGNPLNIINQSINQFIWIWSFLPTPSFRAEEQECRHAGGLGSHDCVSTRGYATCASSRKRHGNGHAKPAGLRVPVRPNVRKFLVKCSTSGRFFVKFNTLFFSTTSSILLRKV